MQFETQKEANNTGGGFLSTLKSETKQNQTKKKKKRMLWGTRAHTHTHTQAQRPCTHRCTERRVGWSLAELCGLCWCQVPAVTLHCGFCFLLLQTVCCRDTRCDYGGMRSRATEPPYHSHKCMHMSFPRCVRRQGTACLHLDLAAHPCLTQGTD
jgi:hypothetical protein